jgi:hypothetical protein
MIELSDITNHQVKLLNSVLNAIGVQSLFKNPDFAIDMDSLGYHHMVINIISGKKRTTPLILFLEGDGIRLDICGLDEAFEWTTEDIYTSRESIIDFFKKLFTSYILVESCSSANAKSRMYLFDNGGILLEKYILRGFIHSFSGWNCDKKLFFPIYPQD